MNISQIIVGVTFTNFALILIISVSVSVASTGFDCFNCDFGNFQGDIFDKEEFQGDDICKYDPRNRRNPIRCPKNHGTPIFRLSKETELKFVYRSCQDEQGQKIKCPRRQFKNPMKRSASSFCSMHKLNSTQEQSSSSSVRNLKTTFAPIVFATFLTMFSR